MTRSRALVPALMLTGALVLGACGGSDSALDAGNDDRPDTTTAPADTDGGDETTVDTGDTAPPPTEPARLEKLIPTGVSPSYSRFTTITPLHSGT